LNDELIEIMEETPDTVIKLSNNKKIVVKEGVDEVIEKIIKYRRKIHI
jgi:flagellar protein FlbD